MITGKGKGFGLAGLALALSFLAGAGGKAWASGTLFPETLSLEVFYGYDGNARSGRCAPVEIRLKDESGNGFSGTLKVATMEGDYSVYSYEYPVEVEQGETLEKEIVIPLGGGSDQVFVSVCDQGGEKVSQKRLKIETSRETAELFIGVLSDHPKRLDYMDDAGISYGAVRTRVFPIQTEEFPDEEIGLDMLDVLVVNDYRLRDLSEEQTRAAMDWVESGGVMLLGTGNRVDDTLGRFAPELLDNSYDNPIVQEIHPEGDGKGGEMPKETVEVPCVRVSLHGGTVLVSDEGYPLLSAAMREQGIVAVAAYDLGDVAEYGSANTSFVDGLFTDILGEDRISALAATIYGNMGEEYWAAQNAINTGNVEKLPNVSLYFLVIAVYIGLAGPGLYLLLKKREQRRYYGLCVAAASALFTAVIYVMGMKTRFTDTFVTYASVEDGTEDTVTETSYINLRNPYSKPYAVTLDPDYTVIPVTRNEYYYDSSRKPFTGEEESHVSVYYGQNETRIEVKDAAAFESMYFRLTKQKENEKGERLDGSVRYYNGQVSGSVTNYFSFDLEDAAVILYGRVIPVGKIRAGETVELSEYQSYCSPVNDPNSVAALITGLSEYERADITDEKYMKALERTNLLSFYMQSSLEGYRSDARVVAFGERGEKETGERMAQYDTFGLTMCTSALEVNASLDRMRYRSGLLKRPAAVQGSFDPAGNVIYSQDPVTVEYALGGDLDVVRVEFCPVDSVFYQDREKGGQVQFSGDMYVYDHSARTFEKMEDGVLEGEEIRRYLSPDNELTIRYISEGEDGYTWSVLPMPMVTGREK